MTNIRYVDKRVFWFGGFKERDLQENLVAAEQGNISALCNLGNYYASQNDHKNMLKYFLMAIDKGSAFAMFELATCYQDTDDYPNMIKYYLMAIDKDDSEAMFCLGEYYEEFSMYDQMLKYYLMAIEKNNNSALEKLCNYYIKTNTVFGYKMFTDMYLQGNRNALKCMQYIVSKDIVFFEKYVNENVTNKNKIDKLMAVLDGQTK
jgi:TPR repeat protein